MEMFCPTRRYYGGVGHVSGKDILRHEIIQFLSTGPLAFSEIQRLTRDNDTMLQAHCITI